MFPAHTPGFSNLSGAPRLVLSEGAYRTMRIRLIQYFERRRCPQAEDLADESVMRLLAWVARHGTPSDVVKLVFGIARNVLAENSRAARFVPLDHDAARTPASPLFKVAFPAAGPVHVLNTLQAADRELLEEYFLDAESSETLAARYGLSPGGVRSRVARLKKRLAVSLHGEMSSLMA
jgi:DNA-directed RNA polymerase specialized sigma24 family protein